MKKLLVILLAALLLLTACTPREPITETPEPTPPPVTEVIPEPDPEPIEEPEPLCYTVNDSPQNHAWDGVRVNIITPVLTGENQAALDVINAYFELLTGKVLDYAEGDLTPNPDDSYIVNAEYGVSSHSNNVISMIWSVQTTNEKDRSHTGSHSWVTFDLSTGNLYTFSDIFGENTDEAKAFIIEKAKQHMAEYPSPFYYEHAETLLASAFDPNNFFYDNDDFVFCYTESALGEFLDVRIPYEELGDLLLIKP